MAGPQFPTPSDTAASEEIEAVVEQIQETMTTEQLYAIEAMELTGEDIFATMQDLGIDFGSGEGRPEGDGPSGGFGSRTLAPPAQAVIELLEAKTQQVDILIMGTSRAG